MENDVTYSIPMSIYTFQEKGESSSYTIIGEADTPSKTRDDRARKSDKKILIGVQKIYILSEDYARFGIKGTLDVLFTTPTAVDISTMAVCKGKSINFLKYKAPGSRSSGDYLDEMLKNSIYYNFSSDENKLIDVYESSVSEGRTLTLPYIELKGTGPEMTGCAVFKDFKMVDVVGIQDTTTLNMIRVDKTFGSLTLEKSPTKSVNIYAKCKRKATCKREEGKYFFTINLDIRGDISENQVYDKLISEENVKEQLEKDIANEVEERCNIFIEKMKNQYKIDMVNLGRIAGAKYGRKTGTDWDKVVCDSTIQVKVNVKIDTFGRGNFKQ